MTERILRTARPTATVSFEVVSMLPVEVASMRIFCAYVMGISVASLSLVTLQQQVATSCKLVVAGQTPGVNQKCVEKQFGTVCNSCAYSKQGNFVACDDEAKEHICAPSAVEQVCYMLTINHTCMNCGNYSYRDPWTGECYGGPGVEQTPPSFPVCVNSEHL